jgi:phosphoribosyl-AMP cyclohydrolase
VTLDPAVAARLKRDADGLVCAVAQQRGTGEVLMVAWMDDEALAPHPHHRPRHVLVAVAAGVLGEGRHLGQRPEGARGAAGLRRRRGAPDRRPDRPACHTGARTCFDADVLLS